MEPDVSPFPFLFLTLFIEEKTLNRFRELWSDQQKVQQHFNQFKVEGTDEIASQDYWLFMRDLLEKADFSIYENENEKEGFFQKTNSYKEFF